MSALSLPTGENILLAAFRSVTERKDLDLDDLVVAYEHNFTTAVAVNATHAPVFERFSLVDPNIRMTVQSATSTI